MTTDEIIALEHEVLAMTARLKSALSLIHNITPEQRDYAGTLWLNVRTLEHTAGHVDQALAERFALSTRRKQMDGTETQKTSDDTLLSCYRVNEGKMGRLAALTLDVGALMAHPEWQKAKAADTALYTEIKRRGLLAHLADF